MRPAERANQGAGEDYQAGVRAGEGDAMEGPDDNDESEEARLVTPAHDPWSDDQGRVREARAHTHVSPRMVCPWCLIGSAWSSQHRRAKDKVGEGVTVVAMDFSS